jgi:integrase
VARQQRRRANGEGSVFYDSVKGTWVGQIELDPDASGRRVRRKFHASTAAEARAKLSKLQAAQTAGQDLSQHAATVNQLVALWLARGLPPTVTDNTRDNYTTLLARHVQPALGTRKATTLTPDQFEAMLDSMAAAGYSARTMRLVLSLLRRICTFGQRRGILLRNPADLVNPPAGPSAARSGLTLDQVRALLAASRSERLGNLIIVSLLLGLRPGEAAGLTWPALDLDRDPPRLRVEHSLRRTPTGMVLAPPKTTSSRPTIALPPPCTRALQDQRHRQDAEAIAAGSAWHNPDDLVFTTDVGTPLDPSNVRRALDRIAATAGIDHLHPHVLRHAAASLLSDHEIPLERIADLLGHRSPTITADIYRHPISELRTTHVDVMTQIADGPAS